MWSSYTDLGREAFIMQRTLGLESPHFARGNDGGNPQPLLLRCIPLPRAFSLPQKERRCLEQAFLSAVFFSYFTAARKTLADSRIAIARRWSAMPLASPSVIPRIDGVHHHQGVCARQTKPASTWIKDEIHLDFHHKNVLSSFPVQDT